MKPESASVRTRRRPRRRAFTLIETVISLLIVGLMLVATLNTVGAAKMARFKHANNSRALLLAQDLMAEIVEQDYWDPDILGGMGPEDPEDVPGNRSQFDDVDDYHGWTAAAPKYRDGTAIPWAAGYKREVAVAWTDPVNLSVLKGFETGVKVIIITVTSGGQKQLTLYGLRTEAWKDPLSS